MKIDATDEHILGEYNWYPHSAGYLSRKEKGETILLHRQITRAPKGTIVDHINGDRTDNRRANLRITNQSVNTINSKTSSKNRSGYRGVSWSRIGKSWRAYITHNYKTIHLGYFKDVKEAARVRDIKAVELFGEVARLNNV